METASEFIRKRLKNHLSNTFMNRLIQDLEERDKKIKEEFKKEIER